MTFQYFFCKKDYVFDWRTFDQGIFYRFVSSTKGLGAPVSQTSQSQERYYKSLPFIFNRGQGAGDPGPQGPRGPKGDKGEAAPTPSGPISTI